MSHHQTLFSTSENIALTLFADEDSEKSDLEEAYEEGRRDEAYEDDGGGFFD